jgi:phosphoribosylformylglycinamidine cyclo-ligase
LDSGLGYGGSAPFAPETSLGAALLVPTRIYVKPILAALRVAGGIKGLAHITGGGFTDNIPRVLPETVAVRVDLSRIPVPPVFGWLAHQGALPQPEMLRTFNCGIGMVIVVDAARAKAVADALAEAGETVVELGAVEARTGEAVVYDGALDLGYGR